MKATSLSSCAPILESSAKPNHLQLSLCLQAKMPGTRSVCHRHSCPRAVSSETAEHSNPGCTIIVLPFRLEPMKTNPVVEGIKLSDTPMQGQPMIHMFDNQGHLLLTDPETGQVFNSDKVAIPELLKLLRITRDPNIDFDSVDYQMHLLSTEPRTFIGRKVFQYFGDAVPPGVYIGQILSHERDAESGNFFQVG
eukprot:SAG11_NODE_79_length_17750_cov_28.445980_2_plen_194_part_00